MQKKAYNLSFCNTNTILFMEIIYVFVAFSVTQTLTTYSVFSELYFPSQEGFSEKTRLLLQTTEVGCDRK